MPTFKIARFLMVTILSSVSATGCAKKTADLSTDQTYLVADSAVSSVNGSLNDSEQANSYAVHPSPSRFEIISTAYAASCGLSRFSPSVGGTCNATPGGKTVTANFNDCTAGRSDEITLDGQVALTFDSGATCNTWLAGIGLPTSGSVTRTTTNFTRGNPGGSVVSVSSAPFVNYAGTSIGGGVTTAFGVGTRTLTINGLHRVRTSATGKTVFDHSVSTTAPLVVTGTRLGGNRTISSGTVKVDHNLAKFSSTASLSGLSWNSSCCHPISGTVTFALVGADTGSIVIDYNTGTCGEANITKDGDSLGTLDLPGCE
jgi:hypothetical protein